MPPCCLLVRAKYLETQVFLSAQHLLYQLSLLPNWTQCSFDSCFWAIVKWTVWPGAEIFHSLKVAGRRGRWEIEGRSTRHTTVAHTPNGLLPTSYYPIQLWSHEWILSMTNPALSWTNHLQWSHHLGTHTIGNFRVVFHIQLLLNILCLVTFVLIDLDFSDWVEDYEKFGCWTSLMLV